MYYKKYSGLIGLVIIFFLIMLSLPFQYRIEKSNDNFDIIEQSLLVSSSSLKKMSLGYDAFVADIYWIRALQYFTNTKDFYEKAEQLYKYFDIITDLDPKFVNAYRFGGSFLAEKYPIGLSEIELGIKLFDKGRRNNPENYRIVLDEAFVYFIYTKDYEKASELFNEASEIISSENRKSSLKGMAALALSKAGNIELSKKIWTYIYKTSTNESRKKFALGNIKELRTMEIENKLTQDLNRYYSDKGFFPENIDALLEYSNFSTIPEDTIGGEFIILENNTVRNKKLADNKYKYALGLLNARIYRYRRLYDRFPKSLEELRSFVELSPLIDFPEHPYGKDYEYDATTGKIK